MASHEIRPPQLRALLLLLVFVPLIPTAMMLRFMIETVRDERAAAHERIVAVYQQTLSNTTAAYARHLGTRPRNTVTAQETHDFFRDLLDRDVLIRISAPDGRAITGIGIPPGPSLTRTTLRDIALPYDIQLFLLDPHKLDTQIQEQTQTYYWIIGLTVLGVGAFAALAALTLSRQIALRDLRSTGVATVAHELRTPLAGMRVLLDTLREGRCRTDQQHREYLDLLAAQNERLIRLSENFLTWSRFEHGRTKIEHTPIPPHTIATAATAPLQPRLTAPDTTFTLDVPENLPAISGDTDLLTIVLTNLLDNALKYTPAPRRITLGAHADDHTLTFEITDNGPGIPTDERRRIFRPFFQRDDRLARTGEGCGLGLAITARIIAAHHGKITVHDAPGGGSLFRVHLPRAGVPWR